MIVTISVNHVYDTDERDEYWVVSDNGNEWDDEEIGDSSEVDEAVSERRDHYAAEGFEVIVIYQ